MVAQLAQEDAPVLDHVGEIKDERGYTAYFRLRKDLTLTLVSGYSVLMRHRIVTRWLELEDAGQPKTPAIPKSFPDSLRLAAEQHPDQRTSGRPGTGLTGP